MLYREYRPKKFVELVGAAHIVSSITGALIKENPAHAYFFTGPRGTGKTTTARLLAKSLNCGSLIKDPAAKEIKVEPCGLCPSCLAVDAGRHLDLIEIDAASNRGIDNIRDLKEAVGLAPTLGRVKVYIIDEVHMLTTEASNALLKTLEEPPVHVYFILCTTNPEKVLDTIKSRCQQFQFKRPTTSEIVEKLKRIVDDKSAGVSDETLEAIALKAKGAFREAETILEQYLNSEGGALEILSLTGESFGDLLNKLQKGEASLAIKSVHEIYQSGVDLESFTEKFIEYTRAILLQKVGVDLPGYPVVESADLMNLNETDLKQVIKTFLEALPKFKSTVIPTLPLELAILDVVLSGGEISIPVEVKRPEVSSQKVHEPVRSAPVENGKVINRKFPYKDLIEKLKPYNHSIHLLLHSCQFESFDGKNLVLSAKYSFHKERVLSHKIRKIIEDVASSLTGSPVIVRCELKNADASASRLTDRNVTSPKAESKPDIAEVFEKVFGDELESL